jgi:hypothetical protein
LRANVSADGLGTNDLMRIQVDGLKDDPHESGGLAFADEKHPLYFALLGPDADGKVNYPVDVYIPPKFAIVGVRAWTATNSPAPTCREREEAKDPGAKQKNGKQSKEAGCVALRLKPSSVTSARQRRTHHASPRTAKRKAHA